MSEVLQFPTRQESQASPEDIGESIERAQELMAELMEYDRVDMYGAEATDAINETRLLAAELTAALDSIPDAERLQNGLPLRTPAENPEVIVTPFPTAPDYPLSYDPTPGDGVRVDQAAETAPGVLQQAA